MKFNVSHTASVLFFGAALIAAPGVVGSKGPLSIDQAFAGPGNGGGKGGGKDHGGGNGHSSNKKIASTTVDEEDAVSKGKLASKLGALNAYHASLNAFAHASPNSRVGKIAAYWEALQAAEADGTVSPEEQTALDDLLDAAANKPIDEATRDAFNQLLRDKFASADTTDDTTQ